MIRQRLVIACVVGLFCPSTFLGCQGYAFQEVPTSVVQKIVWTDDFPITSMVDILFVIDNSGSMAGEQHQLAESFKVLAAGLEENFGDKYRIAVITTGMTSQGCQQCSVVPASCTNESGESGVFQDLIGQNLGTPEEPNFVFEADPSCRIVTPANKDCFYDEESQKGLVFVGVLGCGYEKGLASVREALSRAMLDGPNYGFLRPNATLAVVVVTDEDDCGEVGEINEELPGIRARACYYAAKEEGPDGDSIDPEGKPYSLTPVDVYHDFLQNLKGNRTGMVKFAAIVGIKDVNDPETTTIDYLQDGSIVDVCTTPGCSSGQCSAKPSTRYIRLAQMFGGDGLLATICQADFSQTMLDIVELVKCPREFLLMQEILDPDLANILINDEPVPLYTCNVPELFEECAGVEDNSCSVGECVRSWVFNPPSDPPDPNSPGGTISFADHYKPCDLFEEGQQVHIEFVYVPVKPE
ncbi:MAG: hypothetical protein JRJ87_11645 [Deltaproteobacteria bacterium]|nr:hypothetical protein [Deltaproteobacteria bacterium]